MLLLVAAGCDDDDDIKRGDSGTKLDGGDGPAGETAPPPDAGDTGGGMETGMPDMGGDLGPATMYKVTILHTGDLHSHLQGHGPEADYSPATENDDATIGGFARIAAAISSHRTMATTAGSEVLLVDSGDFMFGTPFQFAALTAAAELSLMKAVGYDVAAIGNHEYDWTPKGLAGILAAAMQKGVAIPLVATNMKFSATEAGDNELEMLKNQGGAADPRPIYSKYIKTLNNGLKVGFIGLLGQQAQTFAPSAKPVTFDNYITSATAAVADLRNNDKVDLVVALSHSGINGEGQGEDRTLAMMVPNIDVIVSGHTHDKLMAPATVGKTLIVAAGAYGSHLGRLDLEVLKAGGMVANVKNVGYTLLPIDDKIKGDAERQTQIEGLITTGVDPLLMSGGLSYKKVVGKTGFDVNRARFAESTLGNLITDSYRAVTSALQPTDPPVLAVEANGNIRTDIKKGTTGDIWFADLHRVIPLGIGPDAKPGYPLVTYYLNGKDLKAGLEISAGANQAPLNDDAYFLQLSGIEVDFKMSAGLFQRVQAARLAAATPGTGEVIDLTNTTKCYKVVTSIYLAGLFGLVSTVSNGLLAVEAKEKDCTTKVTDITKNIVDRDPATDGVQELKNYQAFLQYVSTAANIPIPATYMTTQNRIKIVP